MKFEHAIINAAREANMRPASKPSWADTFLASLEASGFVIVPKEATDDMKNAKADDYHGPSNVGEYLDHFDSEMVWNAMIAARPTIED